MKVLHVVKTSAGARWAALQAKVLVESGIEVHVAMPDTAGEAVPLWDDAQAVIHVVDTSLPVGRPWQWPARAASIRSLVREIKPHLIHSHFFTTTIALRRALGSDSTIPCIFQVPGPLHMEHALYKTLDIKTVGDHDYIVASSRYTMRLYEQAGFPQERLFLSYYGTDLSQLGSSVRTGALRHQLSIPDSSFLVGNICYIYPPKYYLGETTGLKRHEDLIDAISIVCRERSDVTGVLIGGEWGGGKDYFRRLQRRAAAVAGDRIVMLDSVHFQNVPALWPELDCAVHLPISENCGGVLEPLATHVPSVVSAVGGLPEVVISNYTGWPVPKCSPQAAAESILEVLENPHEAQTRSDLGQRLVLDMFDYRRTTSEIIDIYRYILGMTSNRPAMFDSVAIVRLLSEPEHADMGANP